MTNIKRRIITFARPRLLVRCCQKQNPEQVTDYIRVMVVFRVRLACVSLQRCEGAGVRVNDCVRRVPFARLCADCRAMCAIIVCRTMRAERWRAQRASVAACVHARTPGRVSR